MVQVFHFTHTDNNSSTITTHSPLFQFGFLHQFPNLTSTCDISISNMMIYGIFTGEFYLLIYLLEKIRMIYWTEELMYTFGWKPDVCVWLHDSRDWCETMFAPRCFILYVFGQHTTHNFHTIRLRCKFARRLLIRLVLRWHQMQLFTHRWNRAFNRALLLL